MIRTGLPRTKPAIATAVPVNELSSEMTTGMSAPPIGRTIVTPKMRAAARISEHHRHAQVAGPQVDGPDDGRPTASATVTIRPPGIMIGLPGIRPCSLPDAISEPVKVMLPMTMSRTVATLTWGSGAAASPQVVVDRDEGRRAAADRVEQRHQLRHRGHLHGPRGVQAGAATDGDADDDDRPADPVDAAAVLARRASRYERRRGDRRPPCRRPTAGCRCGPWPASSSGSGRARSRTRPPARRGGRGSRWSRSPSVSPPPASADASAGLGATGFLRNIWSIRSVTT